MHYRHAAFIFIILSLLAAIGLPDRRFHPAEAAAPDVPADTQTGPGLLASDASGASIEINTPGYTIDPVSIQGSIFDSIRIPGGINTDRPGAPQLPKVSFLIAAPPKVDLRLSIVSSDARPLPGVFHLPPAPSPAPLTEDLTPGEMVYEPDASIFDSSASFPGKVAEISDEAWIRQQRVFRVDVFPFQYQPEQGTVTWLPNIQIRLDFSGDSSVPVCVDCRYGDELETALKHTILNYDQAIAWRVPSSSDVLRDQIRSPLTENFLGPRYEVIVNQDGIYHLTYADLQAAGMDVDNVDPQTFRLTNQGQDVSIYVFGEGDGSFDPGDYVSFFGQKFHGEIMEARYQASMTKPGNIPGDQAYAANNWFWQCKFGCDLASYFERYTDDNVYYLLEGGQPGPRMGSVNGTPGGAAVPQYYFETVRAEKSLYWWSYEFYDDDIWFWGRIQQLDIEKTYTTTLTAVSSATVTATLHAEVASRNDDPFNSPDHHTLFRFNGSTVHDAYWDGKIRHSFDAGFPQNQLIEGTNTLGLTLLSDTVLIGPDMYFDFFEITYARDFQANDDQLSFSRAQSGTWKYQVDGLTSGSVEVYDILDPINPVRVTNASVGGGTASFQVTDGDQSSYIVAGTGSGVLSPKSIAYYEPPDFAAMAPVDYVLITHADFLNAAQSLAAYRQGQGLSTAVIDVADLYREFNDGIYHPIAIKNFLAYTFANWQTPVKYAALIGSGNWNFKGDGAPSEQYANPPPVYMPPNLAYVDPWQGEVDSANLLATIVGDDTLPDLLIARIPVDTNADLDMIVGKIMAYENQTFSGWQDNILFIADDVPDTAGNFIQLAEGIISTYIDPNPSYQTLRLYQDDGDGIPNGYDFGCQVTNSPECKALTQAITETFNITGTLVVNYLGHASLDLWSKQKILETSDLASINNPTQLPVVLSMTCLDGFWTYPNWDSMAYTFLNSSGSGAVATFSPTGLGVATGHDPLQRGFFASIMENGEWELGAATLESKLMLFATGFNLDLMHTYTLFGDPALGIKNPYALPGLTPTSAGQNGAPGESIVYNLQVKNNGSHPDTFDVILSGNDWFSTPSSMTIGPLNPGQSAALMVTVVIPVDAINNETDTVQVTVRSQGDTAKSATAMLNTTVSSSWVSLYPVVDTMYGLPGQPVTYALQVINTHTQTDTFDLSLSGNSWQVDAPGQVGPVPSSGVAPLQIVVHVPVSANPGQFDMVTVTLTSLSDPEQTAAAVLQTIVPGGSIYLPLVVRK